MESKETQIPVPWGHVAAKLIGNEKDEAVLVFHGVLDNAGSFHNLIPLLPKTYYYICIDLPGHGRSSHFPPSLPIHSIDNLITYKIIAEFFERKNYILMGHSYGGQLGILFTQLYPQYISKLVLLDAFYLFPSYPKHFMNRIIDVHNLLLKIQKQNVEEKPTYTYEAAMNKLQNGRTYGELSREAAEPLLKRMIKPVGNDKYVFTMDQRLKCFVNPSMDFPYIIQMLKARPVNCPVLIILGSQSIAQQIYFRSLHRYYKNLKFKIKIADGDHDVHNTNPESVAPLINQFLLQKKSKL